MTSANPPYPYFNGITYNSQYFTSSSGSGLTQTQANALYLRKTTADTATALETFAGGVITNSIDTSTLASNMTIGKSSNTGTLIIDTIGNMSLGIATAPTGLQKTVSINGTDIGSSRQYITNLSTFKFRTGSGFNELNLSSDTSSNYFAIADRQYSGELRIGGGASVPRSGAISIGTNPSNTCNINISNAPGTAIAPTSGQVNIANGSSGVASSYTVSTNIGAGSTTGALTLGNTNNTTNMNSTTLNIRNTASTNSEINIANTPGTALLPTTGTINIANGTGEASSYSTAVNIGAGTTSGQISIGNPSNATVINSSSTRIGNDASINSIYIGNGNDTDNDIRIVDGTGTNTSTVKICSGTTTGTLTLGNTNNTVQVNGTLSIGTGKGITLSPAASYVLPTTRQLGNIFNGTGTTTTLSGITQLKSIPLNAGTYILNANVRFSAPGANGEISISTSSTVLNQNDYAFGTGIVGLCLNATSFVGITADTTYYLLARAASNGAVSNVSLSIIRIA